MEDHHPSYRVPQVNPRTQELRLQLQAKLSKVRSRGYIEPGFVKSLTGYFPVPKTKRDIQMV
jgi:hypothetical protein